MSAAGCAGCGVPPVVAPVSAPIAEAMKLYAGIFVKSHVVPDAGTVLPQHRHTFPHLSVIATGGVRVWRGDEMVGEFHAPAMVEVPAEADHSFLTLAPATTILCVHNIALGEEADFHEERLILGAPSSPVEP